MPLKLNEKWQIDADSLNWVLEKRRKRKNDDSYYWQPVGYYQNFSHACEAFFEKGLRASTDSWDEVLLAINKAVSDIRSLCAEVGMTRDKYIELENSQQDEANEAANNEDEDDNEDEDWGFLQ